MEEDPPNRYRFKDYKQKVTTLVKEIDNTFSIDSGRIGEVLNDSSKYFSTLNKLKKYIRARLYEGNLSIIHRFQLKNLRACLDFRLMALESKILPLGFK